MLASDHDTVLHEHRRDHLLEGLSALAHDVAEILDRQPVRKQGRIEGHVLGVLREGRRRVEDSTRSPYQGAHVLADVRCSRSYVVPRGENYERILFDLLSHPGTFLRNVFRSV